jgi:hypothetical protein
VRRGSSGAVITWVGDDVTKRVTPNADPTRLVDQGHWLQQHASSAVPHVLRVYDSSYVMERLVVPPTYLLDHDLVMRVMINQLTAHVWSQSAVAPLNHGMLQGKLERLLDNYEGFAGFHTWITRTHASIVWKNVHRCLSHGDPTFDNVMIREETGELVLADPIPATLIVPDMRCVDVGKILQSVLGWERVRYRNDNFTFHVGAGTLHEHLVHGDTVRGFDENEWRASVFWAVVHLLRTLPYVDVEVRLGVRRLVREAISLV